MSEGIGSCISNAFALLPEIIVIRCFRSAVSSCCVSIAASLRVPNAAAGVTWVATRSEMWLAAYIVVVGGLTDLHWPSKAANQANRRRRGRRGVWHRIMILRYIANMWLLSAKEHRR